MNARKRHPRVCESPKAQISTSNRELRAMHRIAPVIAFLVGVTAPAFAQKAEIEAVNAKWIDFFNKGNFAGVASLYTEDAAAFPPGSGMVKGRAAIEAM
jgi:hypothetical protein